MHPSFSTSLRSALAGLAFAALSSSAALAEPTQQTATPSSPFDGRQKFQTAAERVGDVALRGRTPEFLAALPGLADRAERALDAIDMLPVYRDLLAALGDGHSFVQAPSDQVEAFEVRTGAPLHPRPTGPRWTSTLTDRSSSSDLLAAPDGGQIQVVIVPAMSGGGRAANANAQTLYDLVSRDWPRACAAVIDLRGNTGGNAWPMLLALAPILGEGDYGRSLDAAGESAPYARIEDGAVIVLEGEYAGAAVARVTGWTVPTPHTRAIAILIDDATASSGEQVAIEFIGQANVRTFGQKTYGVASSNLGVPAADDINLVVTTALMQDRLGRTWPTGVVPDELIPVGGSGVLDAALAWAGQSPGCAA